MKVVLKPLSRTDVAEIVIVDMHFALGRREAPFDALPAPEVAKLSTRHARIFQEDGNVYVADLGSLNGTFVNGVRLATTPALLRTGDIVAFSGEFKFQVVLQQEDEQPPASPIRLMLLPVAGGEIEPIVIESFPFLVARTDSLFEHYQDRFPDDLRKISRRHALITRKGEQICLEDLGSANGTFVADDRLDEHSRTLASGETVFFGSPRFSYRVEIEQAAPEISQSPKAMTLLKPLEAQLTGGNKTRYVSSAASFLEVFCVDEKPAAVAEVAPSSVAATTVLPAPAVRPTRMARLRALLPQMWSALVGKSGLDRRVLATVCGVIGVVVAAGLLAWILGHGRRQIKSLLDAGSYQQSAAVADEYLKGHATDYEAATWGEMALTKAVVPQWLKLIAAGHYAEAQQFIAEQRRTHGAIKRGQEMLDTLDWAGRVESYMGGRGGTNAPIGLFGDEETITSLVKEWDADSSRHQQLIEQIAAYEPAFEPMNARVFTNLRALRNDDATYLKAIAQLKQDLGTALANNNRAAFNTALSDFAASYPRVRGLELLKSDVEKLDTLARYVEQRQIVSIGQMNPGSAFKTPIVASYVSKWLAGVLPSATVIAGYTQAADAWSRGEGERAATILVPLQSAAWGEVATRQLQHYKQVAADYDAIQQAKDPRDRWNRVVSFSATLQTGGDQYFIHAIQPDLLAHKAGLMSDLDASLRRVQAQWNAYQGDSGIPGVVRVEERVSDRYRRQARRLFDAWQEIPRGNRTYQLLQAEPPASWQALSTEISAEVGRQRRWLQDLNIILEPALLQAKLNLLPQITETTP